MSALREWCRTQQDATVAKHPRLPSFASRLEALRTPVLGLVCFVLLLVVQLTTSHGDAGLFAEAGDRLLRAHADVFRNSVLQVGPLYLLLVGPGALLADALGLPQWAGAALMTSAASAVLLVAAVNALSGLRDRRAVAGLTVLVGGAMVIPATYGHPEEVMTALLLIVATASAADGKVWQPALLLAAAITIKLWAVVGVGLLLVAAGRRLALQRAVVLALAVAAGYLPFVLLDRVATFDMVWRVEAPAPLSLVLADGSDFGYHQRLLQVVVAVLAGAVLARKASPTDVVWALPLGVMSLRLLLDPLSNPYYWTTLVVVVLLRVLMSRGPMLEALLVAYLGNIAMLLLIVTSQGLLGAIALAMLTLMGLGVSLSAIRAVAPT